MYKYMYLWDNVHVGTQCYTYNIKLGDVWGSNCMYVHAQLRSCCNKSLNHNSPTCTCTCAWRPAIGVACVWHVAPTLLVSQHTWWGLGRNMSCALCDWLTSKWCSLLSLALTVIIKNYFPAHVQLHSKPIHCDAVNRLCPMPLIHLCDCICWCLSLSQETKPDLCVVVQERKKILYSCM